MQILDRWGGHHAKPCRWWPITNTSAVRGHSFFQALYPFDFDGQRPRGLCVIVCVSVCVCVQLWVQVSLYWHSSNCPQDKGEERKEEKQCACVSNSWVELQARFTIWCLQRVWSEGLQLHRNCLRQLLYSALSNHPRSPYADTRQHTHKQYMEIYSLPSIYWHLRLQQVTTQGADSFIDNICPRITVIQTFLTTGESNPAWKWSIIYVSVCVIHQKNSLDSLL